MEFKLKRPDPLFCGSSVFTMSANIVSKRAFQERGDKFGLDPIGTGPYQVDRVDLTKAIYLSAFKDYYAGAAATPKLDRSNAGPRRIASNLQGQGVGSSP